MKLVKLSEKIWEALVGEDLFGAVSALLSVATTLVVNSESEEALFLYIAALRDLVDNLDKQGTLQ